jgi:hypothetical protein
MDAIFSFIAGVFQFLFLVAIVLGVLAYMGYNALRALSESIREAWSNIGVVGKKQVSLVNQLIDVVKGYQESEKLVMLKISDDISSAKQVSEVHQQSSVILSAADSVAQRYPELKANEQYKRLIDSIQACETQLEKARQAYNAHVKAYNVKRSSIPNVFYASTIGFKVAPYLEFVGSEQVLDTGAMQAFSSDADGERLNALLGAAGNKMLAAGNKALDSGKEVAESASNKIKKIAENIEHKND